MITKEYSDYLKSKEWKELRTSIIKKRGKKCQRCGNSTRQIELHHLTYKRIFHELPDDLMLLCSICHNKEHRKPAHKRIKPKSDKKRRKQTPEHRKMQSVRHKTEKVLDKYRNGVFNRSQFEAAMKSIKR